MRAFRARVRSLSRGAGEPAREESLADGGNHLARRVGESDATTLMQIKRVSPRCNLFRAPCSDCDESREARACGLPFTRGTELAPHEGSSSFHQSLEISNGESEPGLFESIGIP